MENKPEIYEFFDAVDLLDYLDQLFDNIANDLIPAIESGVNKDSDPESHLSMPVGFSAQIWTRLVWQHWEKVAEKQEFATQTVPGQEVTEVMRAHFKNLDTAIAENRFSPDRGNILPTDYTVAQTMPYYSGFEDLHGWRALKSALMGYGLTCTPYLDPIKGAEVVGIGLQFSSGTQKPIMELVNRKPVAGYIFPDHGGDRPC